MGYLHIENLYKNQSILMFKECFALEKIHGTSAHLSWRKSADEDGPESLRYFAGGASHEAFKDIFDEGLLLEAFRALGHDKVMVYGEAYGGGMQRMGETYGKVLKFIVFDVMIGDAWLNVENAFDVSQKLGLEFVWFTRTSTDLSALDALRDQPSQQAIRNGAIGNKVSEGVVLRPLQEFTDHRGNRVICKHKGDAFSETATPRPVVDPAKLAVLQDAEAIALEWVTDNRMDHVLDKIPKPHEMALTPVVIKAMQEDVTREAGREILLGKEGLRAVGNRAAKLFKARVQRIGA